MKYYVTETNGEVNGCFYTLKEAKQHLDVIGDGVVTMIEVTVNAEFVRRILSNNGGYAKNIQTHIYQKEAT